MLGGVRTKGLIDTGASTSIIQKSIFEKMNDSKIKRIIFIDSDKVSVRGTIKNNRILFNKNANK